MKQLTPPSTAQHSTEADSEAVAVAAKASFLLTYSTELTTRVVVVKVVGEKALLSIVTLQHYIEL